MKKTKTLPIILAIAITTLAGCRATNEQASKSLISNDESNTSSTYESSDYVNISSSSDSNTDSESASTSTIESSATSNEASSIDDDFSSASQIDSSSESTTTYKYSSEDLDRMYSNYIQAEIGYTDISEIDIYGDFYDGKYMIDSFKDNETDSSRPIKTGNAYIDPSTGQGKFWIWGSYNDPDAVDVDFSKYDY